MKDIICTDPDCVCHIAPQHHISLGKKRLCCLTKPEHKCPNCGYGVCKDCANTLQNYTSLEGSKQGKNTIWDDHNKFSPNCPEENTQPIVMIYKEI